VKYLGLAAALAACGSHDDTGAAKQHVAPAPVAVAPPADAAITSAGNGSLPDARLGPVVAMIDPATLPAWDVPQVGKPGHPVELYAVEMDGDVLLAHFSAPPLLVLPADRKLTGRLVAASPEAAAAAIAAQLQIVPTSTRFSGHGATVDLRFGGAPARDLVELLADTGHVNVVAPGELPTVDIVVRRAPWDGVLSAVATLAGRTITRVGNVYYLLPPSQALAKPIALQGAPTVDLFVRNGSIADALAALRQVADVPFDACDATPFSVGLHRVPLGEALRALEVATGTTLERGPSKCPGTPLTAPTGDLTLRATARAGTEAGAVLARGPDRLTAKLDHTLVTYVSSTTVEFGKRAFSFYPDHDVDRTAAVWFATLHRTAALVREGDTWSAWLESSDGYVHIDKTRPSPLGQLGVPPDARVDVDQDGVHVIFSDGHTASIPLGK
jgi:hypothetical protein